MTGQWIFIEANDVLMFRDNKPFSAGQNFVARSMFPPTPQTMQGVIRTHYLETQRIDWAAYAQQDVDPGIRKLIGVPASQGNSAEFGELELRGPWVASAVGSNGAEPLYPVPEDLMQHKEIPGVYATLHPTEADFETSQPFSGWRPLRLDVDDTLLHNYEKADGWMTKEQFEYYLKGDIDSIGILQPKPFEIEERVGLSLDSQSRAHVEGMFYHARYVRPHDQVGLLIYSNIELLNQPTGVINIGGESRSGHFSLRQALFPDVKVEPGRLKVILNTPAYFSAGAVPTDNDWSRWFGDECELIAASIGSPVQVGGWDVANRRPKPIRNYVPVGSIYYFENAKIPQLQLTETPTESDIDLGSMGFGTYSLANW